MSLNLTEMGSRGIKVGGTGIGDKYTVPQVWALIKDRKKVKGIERDRRVGFIDSWKATRSRCGSEAQMLDIDCLYMDIGVNLQA